MSKVQRWQPYGDYELGCQTEKCEDGEFVLHTDYERDVGELVEVLMFADEYFQDSCAKNSTVANRIEEALSKFRGDA